MSQRPGGSSKPHYNLAKFLGSLESAQALLDSKDLAAARQACLEAIACRPYHPKAFSLLSEIALAAGDGELARRCRELAGELTPGSGKRSKQSIGKASKTSNRTAKLEVPESLLKRLSSEHCRNPKLSVCIIAKNEEKYLAQCLQSVRAIANQIVVVDTGSIDRTVEIAKSFGAEIYNFDWCEDFSAARNAALERARGDWVLILDADEELPADQHARLQADLKNRKTIALRLPLLNRGEEEHGRSCVPRLFRNAPGIYFTGRIHEQVFPSAVAVGKDWGLGTAIGTAQILHHGYSREVLEDRDKVQRNLKLLRVAVAEMPEDANLIMNLGLELVRSGELEAGLAQYRRAFGFMNANPAQETAPELREALLTQFTCHLYKTRSHHEVVEVLTSPLAKAGGLTASLHFALGLALYELGQHDAAAEQMQHCLAKRGQQALTPINSDILSAAPYHCLAMSLGKAGKVAAAESAFQRGLSEKGRIEELKLDYARFLVDQDRQIEALQLLHEWVTQSPSSINGWCLGATIALGRPEFIEFAGDWTLEALKHLPGNVELVRLRAEALLFGQQVPEAHEVWKAHSAKNPDAQTTAALILCELVEIGFSTHSEAYEPEIGPITRVFIQWYQRLVAMRCHKVLNQVNERLEALRSVLPVAANMLESAISEAAETAAPAPEPCLA